MDALLSEVLLAFLCRCNTCYLFLLQATLRLGGGISVFFWWVCVCERERERAGEDTVVKIKQPVVARS